MVFDLRHRHRDPAKRHIQQLGVYLAGPHPRANGRYERLGQAVIGFNGFCSGPLLEPI